MNELTKLLIGFVVLIIGFFIGNLLAYMTKDEKKQGQIWFRLITILSLIGGFIALVLGKDTFLFALFFIAIVSSRSLISC